VCFGDQAVQMRLQHGARFGPPEIWPALEHTAIAGHAVCVM
jgi:hypothetical protein